MLYLYHPTPLLVLPPLIQLFLETITFKARINDATSSNRKISVGSLGAIVYHHFSTTNDLSVNQNASVALFVNDIQILTKSRNKKWAILHLQLQVDGAISGFVKWSLGINAQKTIVILFNHNKSSNLKQITINGHQVSWSSHANYFGIHFNRNLSFVKHIHEIIRQRWS